MSKKGNQYPITCPVCNETRLVAYTTHRDLIKGRSTGTCRACHQERMKGNPLRVTHGASLRHRKLFDCWKDMIRRCYNPDFKHYKHYGGRGIAVCDEWHTDPHTFIDWALENGWGEGLSIDRIDNDGGYEPDNCRWADRRRQCTNTSRTRPITYNGETMTLGEWAIKLGVNGGSLYNRIVRLKWPIEKAIETPMRPKAANGRAKAR